MNAASVNPDLTAAPVPADLNEFLSSLPASQEIGVSSEETRDATRILEAAESILSQGETLLNTLDAADYSRQVPVAFNASIGGHYRHCLDHFASVVRSLGSEQVDYDDRERDVRIETQPDFALEVTRQLRVALSRVSPLQLRDAMAARCEVSYQHGNSPTTSSSLGRELAYCIAHAIHHYALIAVMARLSEARLPEHFGIAPSTVAHRMTAA